MNLVNKYSKTQVTVQQGTSKVGDKEIDPGKTTIEVIETDSVAEAVYAVASPSVVGIRITTKDSLPDYLSGSTGETTQAEGSGIIYSSDGYIITNYHVISDTLDADGNFNDTYKINVFLDISLSQSYPATVIGYDSKTDIALIKINVDGLKPIVINDKDELHPGQRTYAIGSSGGLDFMNSLTEGIISGVDRTIYHNGSHIYDLIQTDATINPGNSGGALLNNKGEMIGLCMIKVVADGYENMCFALKAEVVTDVITSILKEGSYQRVLMGITVNTAYNINDSEENGWPVGAFVSSVNEGSCAETAGIKPNQIITKIGDTEIKNFDDLRKKLKEYKPGDKATVTVFDTLINAYDELEIVFDKG